MENKQVDFDQVRKMARNSLSSYAAIMHPLWQPNWHHRVIANIMERVAAAAEGDENFAEYRRVCIQLPPRAGKTELISKLFPGWYMAKNPYHKIISASYGGDLADDMGRKAREYVAEDTFRSLFDIGVSKNTNAITKWELENHSSFFATSVGSALTGYGANCFVAGTKITTNKGDIPIETIPDHLKDPTFRILAHDENGFGWCKVEAFKVRVGNGIYRITTTHRTMEGVTGDHPIWAKGKSWCKGSNLTSGDILMQAVRKTGGTEFNRDKTKVMAQPKIVFLFTRMRDYLQQFTHRNIQEKTFETPTHLQRLWYSANGQEFEKNWKILPNLFEKSLYQWKKNTSISTKNNKLSSLFNSVQVKMVRERIGEIYTVLFGKLCKRDGIYQKKGKEQPWIYTRKIKSAWYALFIKIMEIYTACCYQAGWGEMCTVSNNGELACSSYRYGPDTSCRTEFSNALCETSSGNTSFDEYWESPEEVTSVERVCEKAIVYNLQVAEKQTFFAEGIKVHNCLIIDDPIKNFEDSMSKTTKEAIWNWFMSTAYTRLEKNGAVVVVMTRWATDDLVGRLFKQNIDNPKSKPWMNISFPMIAEEDELYRKKGEPLWPEKYSIEECETIKAQSGSQVWASLYQQRPAPAEGAIFLKSYMRYYEIDDLDDIYISGIFQSWDTGISGKITSARSACTTWGVVVDPNVPGGTKFYLLNVYANQLAFPDLKKKVEELGRVYGPDIIWVEEKATGRPVMDELRLAMPGMLKGVTPIGSKEDRARAISAVFEAGRVYLPIGLPWVDEYVDELTTFPFGAYADKVDSTTQAIRMMLKSQYQASRGRGVKGNQWGQQWETPSVVSIFGR